MEIKILGPGCARCHELDKRTREAVKELGIAADVEYIQDISQILEYNILTTPGLVINGTVVCSGKVPGKDELQKILTSANE
jgi:small redox-active disulfide protein 2